MPPEARPRSILEIGEAVLAVILIAMMSNALLGPLFDPTEQGGDAVPFLRLVWLPVYAIILGLAALRAPLIARFWFPALLLFLLIAWVFASIFWSIDPAVSQRRAIALTATTVLGLYLAARYDGRELSEITALTFLILAVGSYFVSIAVPSMGVHQDVNAGLWRGLWYEKNAMGMMMVYGSLASAAAFITSPRRRPLWLVTLLLCVGLIIMTRSATSFVTLALVLAAAGTLWMMSLGPVAMIGVLWLAVTGVVTVGAGFLLAPDVFFKLVGKDPTLTGRTDIWDAVLRAHAQEPTLGYGYAAFWGLDSAPAKWIRDQLQWLVPSAHNGWLDLMVQLGDVGVILFGAIFAAALVAAAVRSQQVRDGYFAIIFLAVFALQTLSESIILAHNSLPWVLAVAAIARVLGPTLSPVLAPLPYAQPRPAWAMGMTAR